MIVRGDCVQLMRELAPASIDAIVTDPPYGLEFMGKEWDRLAGTPGYNERGRMTPASSGLVATKGFNRIPNSFQAGRPMQEWHEAWAREALRVLKPGGHLLAFGGTRTYHRLACAIEDAGFEIRDCLAWLYGSGFPKSLDVSKAIDKAAGAEREALGPKWAERYPNGPGGSTFSIGNGNDGSRNEPELATAPATPEAQQWQGWGTALKPAHEPIVMARKPLAGTVAQNVLGHGTGALNVDATRIDASNTRAYRDAGSSDDTGPSRTGVRGSRTHDTGRQGTSGEPPARYERPLPSECVCGLHETEPRGSQGDCPTCLRSGDGPSHPNGAADLEAAALLVDALESPGLHGVESGNPSSQSTASDNYIGRWPANVIVDEVVAGTLPRWFYVAKASSAERNAGLDGFEEKVAGGMSARADGSLDGHIVTARNVHPTVKPIELMRWLVRLVTPPGGLVLDPFTGSGTTGIAAGLEGFDFIGMEREPEYADIAEARIAWWSQHPGGFEIVKALEAERDRKAIRESGQMDLLS